MKEEYAYAIFNRRTGEITNVVYESRENMQQLCRKEDLDYMSVSKKRAVSLIEQLTNK